jgi:hypothetical protein
MITLFRMNLIQQLEQLTLKEQSSSEQSKTLSASQIRNVNKIDDAFNKSICSILKSLREKNTQNMLNKIKRSQLLHLFQM